MDKQTARAVPEQFRSFSWKDLDEWTDDGSIRRGKGYVGRVSDVAITDGDHVVATVSGTNDYATEIWFGDDGLEGRCSCPVGFRCKHTVALILKCIDILDSDGTLPVADDDDDRIEELRESAFEEDGFDDFDNDGDDDFDNDDDLGDDPPGGNSLHLRNARARRAAITELKSADELAAYIDALDESSAKRMIIEILAEYGDVRKDWLRRVKAERGDVAQLLKLARKELKRLAREDAWVNPWKHEYNIPDYKPLRLILERLLEKKAFDELVAFGDSLKAETSPQIESAHDEGETCWQICSCMEIVAKAVRRSSLSPVEQMRWFTELHIADDYSAFYDIYSPFASPGDWKTSDWSAFADAMVAAGAKGDGGNGNEDSSDYKQETRMRRIADALVNAGRAEEAKKFQADWLRRRGKYAELANFLLSNGDAEAAWEAAMKGFTARNARDPYKDMKERLRRVLRKIAQARGDMRLALSLQAEDFLAAPSAGDFLALLEAARKEKLDGALRPWLVRFLETGHSQEPCPLAPSGVPLAPATRNSPPGLEILLGIALEEKDSDETLRRWKQLKAQGKRSAYDMWDSLPSYAGEVADALALAHPEESLAIWDDAIAGRLRLASNGNYEEIAQMFRKSRPVMKRLGRLGEWESRIRALQAEYKRRPNFVKALEELFGPTSASARPIIDTRHSKR